MSARALTAVAPDTRFDRTADFLAEQRERPDGPLMHNELYNISLQFLHEAPTRFPVATRTAMESVLTLTPERTTRLFLSVGLASLTAYFYWIMSSTLPLTFQVCTSGANGPFYFLFLAQAFNSLFSFLSQFPTFYNHGLTKTIAYYWQDQTWPRTLKILGGSTIGFLIPTLSVSLYKVLASVAGSLNYLSSLLNNSDGSPPSSTQILYAFSMVFIQTMICFPSVNRIIDAAIRNLRSLVCRTEEGRAQSLLYEALQTLRDEQLDFAGNTSLDWKAAEKDPEHETTREVAAKKTARLARAIAPFFAMGKRPLGNFFGRPNQGSLRDSISVEGLISCLTDLWFQEEWHAIKNPEAKKTLKKSIVTWLKRVFGIVCGWIFAAGIAPIAMTALAQSVPTMLNNLSSSFDLLADLLRNDFGKMDSEVWQVVWSAALMAPAIFLLYETFRDAPGAIWAAFKYDRARMAGISAAWQDNKKPSLPYAVSLIKAGSWVLLCFSLFTALPVFMGLASSAATLRASQASMLTVQGVTPGLNNTILNHFAMLFPLDLASSFAAQPIDPTLNSVYGSTTYAIGPFLTGNLAGMSNMTAMLLLFSIIEGVLLRQRFQLYFTPPAWMRDCTTASSSTAQEGAGAEEEIAKTENSFANESIANENLNYLGPLNLAAALTELLDVVDSNIRPIAPELIFLAAEARRHLDEYRTAVQTDPGTSARRAPDLFTTFDQDCSRRESQARGSREYAALENDEVRQTRTSILPGIAHPAMVGLFAAGALDPTTLNAIPEEGVVSAI